MPDAPRSTDSLFQSAAPGVARLGIGFVNLYAVDASGAGWVLVDTGLPASAAYVRRAVRQRYGEGARPEAIVLTHGHFDHAGNAQALAEAWDVPVYAHPLERPYLTGQSDYPPQDSTMGGAIAQMARVFPHGGIDLGARVRPLPEDSSVPGLPGWLWMHTPGHTNGHVSLWREDDALLLAGDAFATTDLDAWSTQATWPRRVSRPPAPFTPDWGAARESVRQLAALDPHAVAAGHGLPITGPQAARELSALAETDFAPAQGRYVARSAIADETGVQDVPPPAPDPLPKRLLAGALAAGALWWLFKRRGR